MKSGRRPNSVRVGDQWMAITPLQRISVPLLVMANTSIRGGSGAAAFISDGVPNACQLEPDRDLTENGRRAQACGFCWGRAVPDLTPPLDHAR
jgi:hypothetical protein